MNDTANQFLTIMMIKGQLEEIFHALEYGFLQQATPRPEQGFKYNQPAELDVKIHVTNVSQSRGEELHIEEFQRLKTFVESLEKTLQYMQDRVLALSAVSEP